jgi:hypothetical protein
MDREELDDLLEEFDEDESGTLDFKEFCTMMKSWKTRFGVGAQAIANQVAKRGVIGRARRMLNRVMTRKEREKAELEAIKARKIAQEEKNQDLAALYMQDAYIRAQREEQMMRKWERDIPKDNKFPDGSGAAQKHINLLAK